MKAPPAGGRDFIQSLDRGLAVIQAFSDDRRALSAAQVAQRTRLSRAACRRFLVTLEQLGYVSRDQAGSYRLEPAVLRLGYSYLSSADLPQIVRPHCERLAAEHRVSSSLGILDGEDLIFVVRAQPPGYLFTRFGAGSRLPAWSCAMGRMLLAGLAEEDLRRHLECAQPHPFTSHTVTDRATLQERIDDARRLGYAILQEEVALGVKALAVPISWRGGKPAGSLSIGVYDSRISAPEIVARFLNPLRRAAAEINTSLASLER